MPGRLLRGLRQWWRRYRYRFVPWIALNISHNPRTLRDVPAPPQDKVVPDEEVLRALLRLFRALLSQDRARQREVLAALPAPVRAQYRALRPVPPAGAEARELRRQEQEQQQQQEEEQQQQEEEEQQQQRREEEEEQQQEQEQDALTPEDVLYRTLGFSVARAASSLAAAGRGVFVSQGRAPQGAVVSMYPGTVYQKYEPIFFQSIGNPFIFRCLDGVLIDGNDQGISKAVYRSCSGRDRLGPFRMSDSTWLTEELQNPLAVGQYVNNCSNDRPANVCYQELDVPPGFPVELRQYLPNTAYSGTQPRPLRCVVLVALRDVGQGEELLSNYYTLVR